MNESELTIQLAVTELDFELIKLPTIFKISELIVGNGVAKISLFDQEKHGQYAIVELSDEECAKNAYIDTDGIEIENSGHIFNLSFIPAVFARDPVLGERTSSKDHDSSKMIYRKHKNLDDNMIQPCEELDVDFQIPDEFKSQPNFEVTSKPDIKKHSKTDYKAVIKKHAQIVPDQNLKSVTTTLKVRGNVEEVDDFTFDTKDSIFRNLFVCDEFIIDASNKKSIQQWVSKNIIQEKRKHRL